MCPTAICAQNGACAENCEVEAGASSLQSLISSGGGFSNHFPRPAWQKSHVEN